MATKKATKKQKAKEMKLRKKIGNEAKKIKSIRI